MVNTIQKMDKIFRSVRRRIAQCQEKRKVRAIQRGVPYEVGQVVRRKLSPAERRLGKLAPYKSSRYVIIEKQGDTYWCRKIDGTNPRTIQRHYNNLELAQAGTLSWEKNIMDQKRTDSELDTEDDFCGPVSQDQREQPEEYRRRYPMRQRNCVRYLTPYPYANRYEEVENRYTDEDDEDF